MLPILPFLAWLAGIASAVLLITLAIDREHRGPRLAIPAAWFLVAAYCQFLAGSPMISAVGLGLQTLLAIVLLVRFRLSG